MKFKNCLVSIQDRKSLHDLKRHVVLMVLLPHKLARVPSCYHPIKEITAGASPIAKYS